MAKDTRTDRGTAAQSGAGDIAMLGVLPAAFLVPTAAEAMDVSIGAPAPATVEESATPPTSEKAASSFADVGGAGAHALATPTVGATQPGDIVVTAAPLSVPYGAEGGADALFNHAAFGGGHSLAPALPVGAAIPALPTAAASDAQPSPAVAATAGMADAATLETIRASVATLQEAISALGGRLGAAEDTVGGVVADAHQTIAALEGRLDSLTDNAATRLGEIGAHADDIIDGAVARAEAVTGSLTATIDDTITATIGAADGIAANAAAAVVDLGAGTGALVDGALSNVTATVGDASAVATAAVGTTLAAAAPTATALVTGLADTTAEVADPAVSTIANVADTTLAGVGGTLGDLVAGATGPGGAVTTGLVNAGGNSAPAASLLDGDTAELTGADPVAGIGTLVSMVTAADAFHLNDDGDTPLAPALGAIGAADLLAEAHPADSLLGIVDHGDGGLLGGHHDDDHGLLGLG